jgi:hypothetical protein
LYEKEGSENLLCCTKYREFYLMFGQPTLY